MHTDISNQSDGAKPAIGFGPNRGGDFSQEDYHHPAAGWGAAISVSNVLIEQGELIDGARASPGNQGIYRHWAVYARQHPEAGIQRRTRRSTEPPPARQRAIRTRGRGGGR